MKLWIALMLASGTYTNLLPRYTPPASISPKDAMRLQLDKNRKDLAACAGLENSRSAARARSGDMLLQWQSQKEALKWTVKDSAFRGETVESCILRELSRITNPADGSAGSVLFTLECELEEEMRTCELDWQT